MEYNFREVEKKWQKYWSENKTFRADNHSSKPKYYVLDMFPYPSGAGLHVGHPLGYIASDIYARFKRLKGFNVLHPMGYDAFGLPAEQYAIQTGQHPAITTEQNIKRYREQLDNIGFSFDWDREVRTSDPAYYKWTQWIFLNLFNAWYNNETNKAEAIESLITEFEKNGNKSINASTEQTETFSAEQWKAYSEKEKQSVLLNYRLAYLGEAMVNWCPALGTVLANDEVKDGVSERGGYPVERKLMKQWSLRITAYAQRLLDDLEGIDWSESIKEQQRNWIGRSEGAQLKFAIRNSQFAIEVFTTRPDTIFGATFMTLAPEHELVEKIATADRKVEVLKYVEEAKNRSERERMAEVKRITGVFTGAYAEHPFTKQPIPIWVGDYVLAGYGTGAVMAVPAHDSRDHAFAKHFGIEITQVIAPHPPEGGHASNELSQATSKLSPSFGGVGEASYDAKEGKCINSDFLNGLEVKDAIKKAIAEIEKLGIGEGKVNFRLRDAVFGRQRYWGEPIPIYYKDGIAYPVDEKDLPVILPEVDKYLPTEDGEPPLARATNWKYKNLYEFETTTMPGWAGSSWYYLRYEDAHNDKEFVSKEAVKYWQNIDLYIGGSEHATGHLLYFRFWTKFLFDFGLIPFEEPAKKLINQGMIQGISLFARYVACFTALPQIDSNRNILPREYGFFFLPESFPKLEKELTIRIPVEFVDSNYKLPSSNLELIKEHYPQFKDFHFLTKAKYDELREYGNPFGVDEHFYSKKGIDLKNFEFSELIELRNEVEKMSKSKLNVVNPDEVIEKHGADCLRLYEMFLGPLELPKPWNTTSISGTSNFIRKLWRLYHSKGKDEFFVSDDAPAKAELKTLHKTIKKVQEDVERLSFNTSVSTFMICVNELTDLKCYKRAILEPLAIIVSPYAPHIAEELWQLLGHKDSISFATFPEFKEEYVVEDSFDYPVSLNGKTKFNLSISLALGKEEIEKEVMNAEEVKKLLQGQSPKKIIVVPGRIVNIVV